MNIARLVVVLVADYVATIANGICTAFEIRTREALRHSSTQKLKCVLLYKIKNINTPYMYLYVCLIHA